MTITMAITILITAATTLTIALIFFFIYYNLYLARHQRKDISNTSFRRQESTSFTGYEFKQCGSRNFKGHVVSENETMDDNAFYLTKLEAGQLKPNLQKFVFNPSFEEEEEEEKRVEECTEEDKQVKLLQFPKPPPTSNNLVKNQALLVSSASSSPCPTTSIPTPLLPPPPPPLPPPCPPVQGKAANSSDSELAKTKTLASAGSWGILPQTAPNVRERSNNKSETTSKKTLNNTAGGFPTKLKPLHWDKVTADVDHSLVWHQINDGSFRFDDELMETLFGYANRNRETFERNILSSSTSSYKKQQQLKSSESLILEPRKSMNASIILRSLEISPKHIVDALLGGDQQLNIDTLEKLTKISPTKQEITKILQFNNNNNNLPYAESYIYSILKLVPSAFTRFNALLFKSNFHSDILHLKESIQLLQFGCNELRSRGLFLKLLEAILKAGNKLNAGTPRGNAQGFNLSALLKLSDIKSTSDGNTSLLHFVVEQVARSETRHKNNDEEKGLIMLERLSKELCNVKKAAGIEYESFINICRNLSTSVVEIKDQLLCDTERDEFVIDMERFLKECEKEISLVSEEQRKVMELVKRTTEYYQATKEEKGWEPFQIFIIVKDFVEMVDQVRLEIITNIHKKNSRSNVLIGIGGGNFGLLSPPLSPTTTTTTTTMVSPVRRFLNFHSNFISDMSLSSTESDVEI